MSDYTQIDFFPETREERLERKNQELAASLDKLRRSHFHRYAELQKKADQTRHDLDTLIAALCRAQDNGFADLPLFVNQMECKADLHRSTKEIGNE